jgi:hypothetical protein
VVKPIKDGKLVVPKSNAKKRVTLILPAGLDFNLEIYCKATGRLKMDVTKEALIKFLESVGIPDPMTPPIISWPK